MESRQYPKNCTPLDIAKRAVKLHPGETLYFAASLGGCGLISHGVTHLRSEALDSNLLIFSAVGGGNAFVYNLSDYLAERVETEIADLIAAHGGGVYCIDSESHY